MRLPVPFVLVALVACTGAPLPETPTVPSGPGVSWSDPVTWGGAVPGATSSVTIPAGKTVVLDQNVTARNIMVLGNLVWADKDGLELKADSVMVHGPGSFRIGSNAQPFTKRATITLTGSDPNATVMNMGAKVFGAMMGGKIEIYGEQRVNWTRLAGSAAKGATQLTLTNAVDWRPGERVVVASSALDPSQAEERAIKTVSGNTVTLEQPLNFLHYAEVQTFGGKSVDSRVEVGLLSRNIVIQGDDGSVAAKFGGHVMVMGSDATKIETDPALRSSAKIRGVEFRRMGQFDRLGRYPFHWHLNGATPGDYLEGSSVHSSIQRGIVVHGTSNVRVANNVVYNTPGHAIGIETGAELDNTLEGNLALSPQPVTFTQATLRTQGDNKAAAYWIKGVNNVFLNNAAAGGEYGGFWFDDPEENTTSRLTFRGNTAHSHGTNEGAGVWLQGRRLDYSRLEFTGLNLYKNGVGFWPDNDAPATVTQSQFADNRVAATGDVNVFDAVIVGRSANTDVLGPTWAARWGGSGIEAYNTAATMKNVTFVNFTKDGAAVRTVACRNEGVRFRAEATRWVNAAPDYCAGDTVVTDVDGTFSGTGRPTTVVSDPIMHTGDLGCTTRADGATLCPPDLDYQYLFARRDLNLAGEIRIRRVMDGLMQNSTFFPGFAVAIPGKAYALETGLDVVPQISVYLSKARKDSVPANPATRVQVSLPAPNANFKVWRGVDGSCYTCGFNPNSPSYRTAQLQPASSLQAMLGADGEGYFYDSAAKTLHLLLGPTKPVFVERSN